MSLVVRVGCYVNMSIIEMQLYGSTDTVENVPAISYIRPLLHSVRCGVEVKPPPLRACEVQATARSESLTWEVAFPCMPMSYIRARPMATKSETETEQQRQEMGIAPSVSSSVPPCLTPRLSDVLYRSLEALHGPADHHHPPSPTTQTPQCAMQ